MKKRPNILFIFSDQHNARCMSNANHPQVKTPNLDRLCQEGIKFNQAYCNNPICTPSRISFLSSLYPSTHGYYGLYGQCPPMPMTNMFSYFKSLGYRTGALGKLHTPRYWIEKDCQFVYDEFIEYPKYLEGARLYEQNDNREFINKEGETSYIPFEHSCEMALVKQTKRFINNEGEPKDRGDDEQPFMGWISFSRPHEPYTPSEPFASMYPEDKIELPPINYDVKKDIRERTQQKFYKDVKYYVSAYYSLISQIDSCIGYILEELEEKNLLENTIIIYTSDHGDYAGEHGMIEKISGLSSNAICKIPMIIRLPEQQFSTTTIESIVESVDLFPTLCDLIGVESPNTIQGKSMYPLMNGQKKSIKSFAFTEEYEKKTIATEKFRYVVNDGTIEDELYDIQNDPWEHKNLIHEGDYKDTILDLQRKMLSAVFKNNKPIVARKGGWHHHEYDDDQRALV